MLNNKYLLSIPAYNEDRSVVRTVREAKRYVPDILVVDDGSVDATPALLKGIPNLRVIRHARNLGYGRSLCDAFDYAIGSGYDWVLTMDCDEQHEPSDIPRFVTVAERGEVDIVSGSRYLLPPAGSDRAPRDRRKINRQITQLLNENLGLGITDAFCGFKAYRTGALRRLRITEPGYAMPLQAWVQAARAGLRITEIPVRLIYNSPMRRFGGGLDDPAARYAHYLEVLGTELAATRRLPSTGPQPVCQPC
jgi:dolichol-phosphate mannosyltransferase